MAYLRFLLSSIILWTGLKCVDGAPTHLVLRMAWDPSSCVLVAPCSRTPFKAFTIERLFVMDNNVLDDSGQYENCYAGPQDVPSALPPALQDSLRCLWRNKTGSDEALWTEQWRKYGACTGLSIADYFQLAVDKFNLHDANKVMADSGLKPPTIDRDDLLAATAAAAGARTWAACDPPTKTLHISSVCMSPQPPHTPIDCPWGISRVSKYDTECQGQLDMPIALAQTVDPTCAAYIPKTYEYPTDGGGDRVTPPAPPLGGEVDGVNGSNDSGGGSSSASIGAIVGGVIGGLAVVALAVAAFLVYRQRGRRSETASGASNVYTSQQQQQQRQMQQKVSVQALYYAPAYAISPPDAVPAGAWTSDGHTSAATSVATRSTGFIDNLTPFMASATPSGTATATAPRSRLAAWQLPYEDIVIERPAPGYAMEGVFKAAWNHTTVAVQVVASATATASQDDAIREVEAVVELLAGLHHPNIVQFLGYCTWPSCLVTEYVERGSLCAVLADAAADPRHATELTWERRIGVSMGACNALLYCHTRPAPIVHQAVSSMTLLVGADWTPKLAGFEHACVAGKSARAEGVGSNPRWLSPQALAGAAPAPADDIYSLGVVLWELLTFQVPWGDAAPWTVATEVQAGRRPPVPAVPQPGQSPPPPALGAYVALMQRCWAQQPQDRPSLEHIMAELKVIHPGLE